MPVARISANLTLRYRASTLSTATCSRSSCPSSASINQSTVPADARAAGPGPAVPPSVRSTALPGANARGTATSGRPHRRQHPPQPAGLAAGGQSQRLGEAAARPQPGRRPQVGDAGPRTRPRLCRRGRRRAPRPGRRAAPRRRPPRAPPTALPPGRHRRCPSRRRTGLVACPPAVHRPHHHRSGRRRQCQHRERRHHPAEAEAPGAPRTSSWIAATPRATANASAAADRAQHDAGLGQPHADVSLLLRPQHRPAHHGDGPCPHGPAQPPVAPDQERQCRRPCQAEAERGNPQGSGSKRSRSRADRAPAGLSSPIQASAAVRDRIRSISAGRCSSVPTSAAPTEIVTRRPMPRRWNARRVPATSASATSSTRAGAWGTSRAARPVTAPVATTCCHNGRGTGAPVRQPRTAPRATTGQAASNHGEAA